MATVATLAGAGLVAAGGIGARRPRNLALAAIVLVLVAGVLLSVGIRGRDVLPDRWDDLVRGIATGIGALPGTLVPYRGDEPWVRHTLLLGGSAMAAIAVLQGFWPREPGRLPGSVFATAFTVAVLYGVPAVERESDRPFLSGALFAVLLAGFLFADRLRPAQLAPAAVLLGAATGLALLLAPSLDRREPWVDYEQFARSVAGRGAVGYRWDHGYGPLDWPRRGRELLRVSAERPAYWKAGVLDTFDGRGWRQGGSVPPFEPGGDQDRTEPSWFQRISVAVANLRSTQFVTAGEANRISSSSRRPVSAGGGTFETASGALRKGATYRADVYTPTPTPAQLRSAGTGYGSVARPWLRVRLTPRDARATGVSEVAFPPFGSGEPVLASLPAVGPAADPEAALATSGLGRTWDLAQRLRATAPTAYDYVRAVRARVMAGAAYTERSTVHANPVDAFLFDDRNGYCQHFSAAMALLLRMGGVPARVAVGFTPGVKDAGRNRWVVRDYDAHSWVEAHFPRYGWITFDPTPAGAPAREQSADALDRPSRGGGAQRGADAGGDRIGDPGFRADGAGAAADGGRSPWLVAGGGAALLALGAAGAVLGVRRRRARTAGRAPAGDPWLAELERALRRTGRDPGPGATLGDLRRELGGEPAARGYLDALSARRFGRGGPPPTAAQRSALRRALTSGRRRRTALRAWLAVPPWPPRDGRAGRYPR
jgi:transglutaminase-like putative cysteine protease